MTVTENGWPHLTPDSRYLYTWNIPTKEGMVHLRLRSGSAGFLLAFAVSLWAQFIEPVIGKVLDDWGYADRPIRAGVVLSNHASGTAADLNALRHGLGQIGTVLKAALWRVLMATRLRGLLRWGGDYHNRKDEMHTEIAPGVTMSQCEQRAKVLMGTKRGKAILAANPEQANVILSRAA